MVANGSKSGKKPLLPFFFELWLNIKKTAEKDKILCLFRRFYLFRALSLFVVEHVLGKDEVAGSNPAISSIYGTPKEIRCSFFIVIAGCRNNVTRLRLRRSIAIPSLRSLQIPLSAPFTEHRKKFGVPLFIKSNPPA